MHKAVILAAFVALSVVAIATGQSAQPNQGQRPQQGQGQRPNPQSGQFNGTIPERPTGNGTRPNRRGDGNRVQPQNLGQGGRPDGNWRESLGQGGKPDGNQRQARSLTTAQPYQEQRPQQGQGQNPNPGSIRQRPSGDGARTSRFDEGSSSRPASKQ